MIGILTNPAAEPDHGHLFADLHSCAAPMNSSGPLVLSRATITIISLIVALPLAAWPLLYLPLHSAVIKAAHWCIVEGAAWMPLAFFMMLVFESTFRWKSLKGLRRLPWISIFFVPAIVLCLLALFMTHAMLISNVTPYPGVWSITVLLFFQLVGHASLSQSVEEDRQSMATDTGR
jgi:hypothetical protein